MEYEAREDPNDAMKFIAQISHQISQFEDITGEEDNKRHVMVASNTGSRTSEGRPWDQERGNTRKSQ
jgi:hypothetical protein